MTHSTTPGTRDSGTAKYLGFPFGCASQSLFDARRLAYPKGDFSFPVSAAEVRTFLTAGMKGNRKLTKPKVFEYASKLYLR